MLVSALDLEASCGGLESAHEALRCYNANQQLLESVLTRFDSRQSQMTLFDSDWAGGTEGSDLRLAREFGLDRCSNTGEKRDPAAILNNAKSVASEVFPLERAVTPFSEYKLRLGIGITIENGIFPKTAAKVREWLASGGKLKVGGDVLIGLKRWETLVDKPREVDMLLTNMKEELAAAEKAKKGSSDAEAFVQILMWRDAASRFTALGFQAKGLELVKAADSSSALTCLLRAPHVLHCAPKALEVNTEFEVLMSAPGEGSLLSGRKVKFQGFAFGDKADLQDLTLRFSEGEDCAKKLYTVRMKLVLGQEKDFRDAETPPTYNPQTSVLSQVPGEIVSYQISPGDQIVKKNQPLVTIESMKMEIIIPCPPMFVGKVVKALGGKARTSKGRGDVVKVGELLVEFAE